MPEHIEREAFRKSLLIGSAYLDEDTMMTVVNVLDCFPAADVAPVRHAKWEHDHYENCCDNFEIVKCSCCGHQAYAIAFYVKSGNYCPNCGAKMDLEDTNHGK